MKNKIYYLFGALAVLASCGKEVEKPEEPVVSTGKELVTLIAQTPQTRTTAEVDGAYVNFNWQSDEMIAVVEQDAVLDTPEKLNGALFTISNQENGAFTGTKTVGKDLLYAVSPASDLASANGTSYTLTLPETYTNYVPGTTNAVMIGVPDGMDGEYYKFKLSHAAALVKYVYKNIPVGTTGFKFTTDVIITGSFNQTTANNVTLVTPATGSKSVTLMLASPITTSDQTLEFFIPVPTGDYGYFRSALLSGTGDDIKEIASSVRTKTLSESISLSKGDVFLTPSITLYPYEGAWIMVGKNTANSVDKYYASLPYDTENKPNNIKSTEVTVEGKKVTSTEPSIKITITPVKQGTYAGLYTIQDSNSNYLYAASSSNNYLKAAESIGTNENAAHYYWSIKEDGGSFTIVAKESTNRNSIRFNYNNDSPIFSCYAPNSTTGTQVTLYKWDDADVSNPPCATPSISCANNTITITCSKPANATIYYVIGADSSVADPIVGTSSVYDPDNKPKISEGDGYVKAIATAEGYSNSAVAGQDVVYTDPEAIVYYAKITSLDQIVSGEKYVIVGSNGTNNYALPTAPTVNNGKINGDEIEIVTNKGIASEVAQNYLWTLTKTGEYFTISDGSKYIYHSNGGNSGTNLTYGTSTIYLWKITPYSPQSGAKGVFEFAGVAYSNNKYTVNSRGMLVSGSQFGGYALSNYNGNGYCGIDLYMLDVAWDLKSIAVTTAPTKTTYDAGDFFDPTGMVVTAHYEDHNNSSNTKDVVIDNANLTFSPETTTALAVENNSVTITYSGVSTSQAITVIQWDLKSIAVTTAPTKTTYDAGDFFDPTGMVVTAHYEDHSNSSNTKDVVIDNANLTFSPETTTALAVENNSVTITYSGVSTSQAITVIQWVLKSIAVTHAPNKVTYTAGQYFDPTGMVVTARYEDQNNNSNTKDVVIDNADLTFSPTTSTALTTDVSSVTIFYLGKETTQAITVNPAPLGPGDYSANYTGNITLSTSGGTQATACKIKINTIEYDGIKAGTNNNAGAVKIVVPSGTKYLHLHVAGWNNDSVTLSVSPTGYSNNITLTSNSGISGNSPFTFSGDPFTSDYYKVITFADPLTQNTELTFTATSGKRFVVWGVTAEGSQPSNSQASNINPVTVNNWGTF